MYKILSKNIFVGKKRKSTKQLKGKGTETISVTYHPRDDVRTSICTV